MMESRTLQPIQLRGSAEVPVFNVYIDHDVQGLAESVRKWLLDAHPQGVLYYPTTGPFPDLTGLPAGVIEVSIEEDSRREDQWHAGFDLYHRPFEVVLQRIYGCGSGMRDVFEEHMRGNEEDLNLPVRLEMLPCRRFLTTWNDLVFEPAMHAQIFNSLARTLSYFMPRKQAHPSARDLSRIFNGLILLWGPPGSGKSSLCRALAQKLSVRFKDEFPHAVLLELDPHAMHSKYFGESAKLVQETFDRITKILSSEPAPLVCVLIDEVEGLAASRDQGSGNGNEPKDAMRALNALLTAMDRMRNYHNLLVFCTSNIVNAMDDAFLDRFDFKWHVPEPTTAARYEILRRRYMQLMDDGAICAEHLSSQLGTEPSEDSSEDLSVEAFSLQEPVFPPHQALILYTDNNAYSTARRLEKMAILAAGVSGRSLCKLPWTSLVFRTDGKEVSLTGAMDALEESLQSECQARKVPQKVLSHHAAAPTMVAYG